MVVKCCLHTLVLSFELGTVHTQIVLCVKHVTVNDINLVNFCLVMS